MTRVIAIALAAALAACASEPRPRHRAAGTLVHDGLAPDDRTAWSTELELLRSRALLDDVGRALAERGSPIPIDAVRRGLTVRRVKDSRIIEIAVALDDAAAARDACNLLIRTYLERRLERAYAAPRDLGSPAIRNDVRILDSCTLAKP